MKPYRPKDIESKWQNVWEKEGMYRAEDFSSKPKRYILDMFPYPSGEGLHVGHPLGYIATDVFARYSRMRGCNVLHPMGWDAFGLPAENYALQHKIHPKIAVAQNIARFKDQLRLFGFSYDWSREINTTDPKYYRWTQWIFLKLFERGLAYQAEAPVNFCPKDKTALANEEVVDGKCERCGSLVERRMMRQWMLKITAYADRLLEDLEVLDWPERIKEMQRNWIGRSEGAEIDFTIKSQNEKGKTYNLSVFTTRPDTLFGATYIVLAPEHPLIEQIANSKWQIANRDEAEKYVERAKRKGELERQEEKEKTGVRLVGIVAVNPGNSEELPVFVADYVLGHYGTGAIMAVPAHDERDFRFAEAHGLQIRRVIAPQGGLSGEEEDFSRAGPLPYVGEGKLMNSGTFSGLSSQEARKAITEFVSGKEKITYKLRDWIFSRQRFWGEPIPIIHCSTCGVVPVSEKDLPVLLPDVEQYESAGTGESPLAAIAAWVNVPCPQCKGPAKRETNTMPQWAGSCWYYLRFLDPHNAKRFADGEKERYWMPVDLYLGGAEHAVLHLLYARFWHKVLYDAGHLSTSEPFQKLFNQGMILGADHQKMSKSRGNIIQPDEIIASYGADTVRLYELFLGPLETEKPWDTHGIIGLWRFLNRTFELVQQGANAPKGELRVLDHRTIQDVTNDIKLMKFNTAIAWLMGHLNAVSAEGGFKSRESAKAFVKLLAPLAPHITEELWQEVLGEKESVHEQPWPTYDPAIVEEENITMVVQVNGRTRGQITLRRGATEAETRHVAGTEPHVAKYLTGVSIERTIFIQDRLINFVVKE